MPTSKKKKMTLEKLHKMIMELREKRGEYKNQKEDWTVECQSFSNKITIRNEMGTYLFDLDLENHTIIDSSWRRNEG